ncbi:WD repeat-containing protein slp1 [Mucor velutinosus]|uniref:WD repeat-containing protein slp1 n=1 Tax=Mucor velutinosus TaxID=708070 RepID=A0AAN7DFK3_9FUNG|nr:WD repeat-containing protein slp1 [Mucor velutinosus]
MLTIVPKEILGQIIKLLSRHDMYQLVCTCNYMYLMTLPSLYSYLELGYHVYVRQLRHGVKTNLFLRNTIGSYTKHLELRSRQNKNCWRVDDLTQILSTLSRVETLSFTDFHALSTETILNVVASLPSLKHIEFKYCHILSRPLIQHRFASNDAPSASNPLPAIYSLSYIWTDFTKRAIAPCLFPQITNLELGSNRNKYESVNGLMVNLVTHHCPNITHLTIALPQVDEPILCDTIAHYGAQLQQLSIKCVGYRTLLAISAQALNLQKLALRVTSEPQEEEDISPYMTQIITACKRLESFEIASTQLDQHVPNKIWEAIIAGRNVDLTNASQKRQSRAQFALMVRQKNQMAKNDSKSGMASRQRLPLRRNSVWFDTVSEEVLEQRYHYNNSISGRYQHRRNNFEQLQLTRSECMAIRDSTLNA